jgi:hypothetical protein
MYGANASRCNTCTLFPTISSYHQLWPWQVSPCFVLTLACVRKYTSDSSSTETVVGTSTLSHFLDAWLFPSLMSSATRLFVGMPPDLHAVDHTSTPEDESWSIRLRSRSSTSTRQKQIVGSLQRPRCRKNSAKVKKTLCYIVDTRLIERPCFDMSRWPVFDRITSHSTSSSDVFQRCLQTLDE